MMKEIWIIYNQGVHEDYVCTSEEEAFDFISQLIDFGHADPNKLVIVKYVRDAGSIVG